MCPVCVCIYSHTPTSPCQSLSQFDEARGALLMSEWSLCAYTVTRRESPDQRVCACLCVCVEAGGVTVGWIEAAVLTLILCVVLFGLPRFGFSWTMSRDYKACFSSAILWGRREGPCKALWLDFSPHLVVLRCKQDIKDRGDGELMSLCVRVCMGGCLSGFQALSSVFSMVALHTQLKWGIKTPVGPR